MVATIKNITTHYSDLHDVARAIIEIEEDTMPILLIGPEAKMISECVPGTRIEIRIATQVTLIDNRQACLIDYAKIAA